MPHTFVQVGSTFINLELVTCVELVLDPVDQTNLIGARVHYTSGPPQDFKRPPEVQALVAWLRSHQAP